MKKSSEHINRYRVRQGPWASDDSYGMTGAFMIPFFSGKTACVLSSDGSGDSSTPESGWEHVSISLPNRCPTWEEMVRIKDLFWDENEAVVQIHPPKSEYVNNHPHCLHLWRPVKEVQPLPPSILVGIK